MKLRNYQGDANQAIFEYWASGGGNPLIEAATGLGKSVIIAHFIRQMAEQYPNLRMMMLTHAMELIEQNYKALVRAWPGAPAGIYNASLGRKDFRQQIIFGSVQSVANNPELLAPRHLIAIDEAHLVSPDDATRYQKVFRVMREKYPQMRVVGFTATPYRLDTGSLVGEGQIFDEIVYKYNIGDGIRDGWLTPVTSSAQPKVSIDVSNIGTRGGEFIEKELQEAAGDPAMILAACEDMIRRTGDRSSLLVFCVGVAHAEAVADCLRTMGQTAETVTGNTGKMRRKQLLEDFKAGRIRFLTNANVLTTGFDAPNVDCVVLMRPTLSTSLYVQMIGRGTRITETLDINQFETAAERCYEIAHSVKPNCLVLDYAGNLARHGPVNLVTGMVAKVRKDDRAEGVKDCTNPECGSQHDLKAWEENDWRCPDCNTQKCKHCKEWSDHELWEGADHKACPKCGKHADEELEGAGRTASHEVEADGETILIADIAREKGWRQVLNWEANLHSKKLFDADAIDTIRITYFCEFGQKYQEWLFFDHPKDGFPYRKSVKWWKEHGGSLSAPESVKEALDRFPAPSRTLFEEGGTKDSLTCPRWIVVEREDKFDRITDRSFDQELEERRVHGALW